MILKKPYAFFIKNFKLFHLILFVLSSILLYRTSLIYGFMKEYSKTSTNVIGKELTTSLFVPWAYILIAILIIVNILLIVIMIRKDKPYIYYIINIGLYIGTLITYVVSNRVIGNMETMLVAARTTLAIRDITNIARLLQTVSVIFYFIRATGFDIKKFDFVRDLQSLDISEEDSEEIEVAIEFERNEIIRKIKRTIRNAKYYYNENKFILNIIILLFISFLSLLIYLSANKYDKVYKENEFFNANGLNIGVIESDILTKNYKKETITSNDNVLVAVKVSLNSYKETQLETSRFTLVVNNTQYYHIKDYATSLIDIGNVYSNEKITKDFEDYVLVYQIPKEDAESKMIFRYIDTLDYKRGKTIVKSIDVKINPKKIDEIKETTETYQLTNEINTSNYKINISNYEINNHFKTSYKDCITSNECYDFQEILTPSIASNNEKSILKLEGNIEYETAIGKITDLFDFIEKYGSIEYTYNGKTYTETNDFYEVKPSKTKLDNTYFIEINKEIKDAETIKLVFNIRNNRYEYILRGNTNE